jgi:hypothetical protein
VSSAPGNRVGRGYPAGGALRQPGECVGRSIVHGGGFHQKRGEHGLDDFLIGHACGTGLPGPHERAAARLQRGGHADANQQLDLRRERRELRLSMMAARLSM